MKILKNKDIMSATEESKPKPKVPKLDNKKTIADFIDLMREIFEIYTQNQIVKSRGLNPMVKFLNNYEKILKASKFSDHAPLFVALFKKYRNDFLKIIDGDEDALFLTKEDIQIWYGEQVPRVKVKNFRLPISACFKKAHQMRDEIERRMTGNTEEDAELMSEPQYILVIEMQYYIVKLIRLSVGAKSSDYDKLQEIETELGEEAGIGKSASASGAGFMKVAKNVAESMREAGFTGPDGKEIDPSSFGDPEQVGQMIIKTMTNPKLLRDVGKSFGDIKKDGLTAESFKDAIAKSASAAVPHMKDVYIDFTKPPPGVNVSPESQKNAEEMYEYMKQATESIPALIENLDLSSLVPTIEAASRADDDDDEDDDSD